VKRIIVVLSLLVVVNCPVAYGQEEFPFLAEINAKSVNVRAGQSVNFEKLGTLHKGDKVVVLGRNYSWSKIRLPAGSGCYIYSNYVNMLSGNIGSVTGDRVNIRAGSDVKSSILGQLRRGTKIRVHSRVNDWFKIEPIEGIYGWILSEYVTFKAKEIPPPKVVSLPTRNIYARKRILEAENRKKKKLHQVPKKVVRKVQSQQAKPIAVIGVLKRTNGEVAPSGYDFKVVVDEGTVYYLVGPSNVIATFVGSKVRVTGTTVGGASQPVIKVKRIQFVL